MTFRPRRPAGVLAVVPFAVALAVPLAVHDGPGTARPMTADCFTAVLPQGGELTKTRTPDMGGSPLRFYMLYCPEGGSRDAAHHPLW
ncbi:hypothetical protein [Thermomonospora umbrina]|uniref:Uncharacterized protein n=1 Tax=Thermomonospora umbrina TaxID=111806 RepID=A0A3D9T0I3_9ACTN|nr:hypothetical protein [Thermomonospora umbrina]REE99833.1 hypothetical protein DFJ69_5350 [Thermomonospora umbrina]